MTLRSFFRRRPPGPESPAPRPSSTDSERYACGDLALFPLGVETALVYSRTTGRARALAPETADLLRRCASFATLDEHVEARRRELGLDREHEDALREQLEELAAAGLMIASSETKVVPPAGVLPPLPIDTIGFVTRDRLDVLLRAVESYAGNAREHGREVGIAVMDDSPAPATRAETRRALAALGQRLGVSIRYGGLEEKRTFADVLGAETGVAPGVIEFALFDPEECGLTFGANHNALALDVTGERLFAADDDTVCRLARMPGAAPGLVLHSGPEPTEFHFFPDRAAALDSAPAETVDLLGLHERFLGRGLSECVAAAHARSEAVEIAAPMLRALHAGGRIPVTLHGLLGDSGMGSPRYYLGLDGPSRERLVRTEGEYRWARQTREIARGVRTPTISDTTFCMSAFLGFDHRDLLPPFFPVRRNSDGVFGVTLRVVGEHHHTAFVPWTLLHAPREPRAYGEEDVWRQGSRLTTADVVISAIATFAPPPGEMDAAARMRGLGRHLQRFAALSWREFDERVRMDRYRRAALWAAALEDRLRTHRSTPAPWAEDVRRAVDHAAETLTAENYGVPRDLEAGRSTNDARALLQRLIRRYGELLEMWPTLVDEAQRLRARGHRLAQPV